MGRLHILSFPNNQAATYHRTSGLKHRIVVEGTQVKLSNTGKSQG